MRMTGVRPNLPCRICSGQDLKDFERTVERLVALGGEVDVHRSQGKEVVGLLRPEFAVELVRLTWNR